MVNPDFMASSIRIEDSARGKREREKKEISPDEGRERERQRERRIYVFPVYKYNIYANNYGRIK